MFLIYRCIFSESCLYWVTKNKISKLHAIKVVFQRAVQYRCRNVIDRYHPKRTVKEIIIIITIVIVIVIIIVIMIVIVVVIVIVIVIVIRGPRSYYPLIVERITTELDTGVKVKAW